jgi:hypothetical protein
MCEITEKLEFNKMRTVKVCTRTGAGRSPEHKNPYFRANVQQSSFGKEES